MTVHEGTATLRIVKDDRDKVVAMNIVWDALHDRFDEDDDKWPLICEAMSYLEQELNIDRVTEENM